VHFHSAQSATIVLKQGIKRQIRLMFHELGYEVKRLKRVRIGGLKLGSLPAGSWRELTPSQIAQISGPRSKSKSAPAGRREKPGLKR
jgi:16S rRNA U516 pseudouridylate synthase RsuA-like enzyme